MVTRTGSAEQGVTLRMRASSLRIVYSSSLILRATHRLAWIPNVGESPPHDSDLGAGQLLDQREREAIEHRHASPMRAKQPATPARRPGNASESLVMST